MRHARERAGTPVPSLHLHLRSEVNDSWNRTNKVDRAVVATSIAGVADRIAGVRTGDSHHQPRRIGPHAVRTR